MFAMNLSNARHISKSLKLEVITITSKFKKHLSSAIILNSIVLIILFGTIGYVTTMPTTKPSKNETTSDLNLALDLINAQKRVPNKTEVAISTVTIPEIKAEESTPIAVVEVKEEKEPVKQNDVNLEIEKIVKKIGDDSDQSKRKRALVARRNKTSAVDTLDNETARLHYLKTNNIKKGSVTTPTPEPEMKYYGIDSSVFIPFENDPR
ncbi:MAG: hypothetical protein ABIE74_00800 [Pseudomonadota bacterium]